MHVRDLLSRLRIASTLFVTGCTLAAAQSGTLENTTLKSTPAFVKASTTTNLGPEDPSKIIDVSVWLNLHNRTGLDALYSELYDPSSSKYHAWLTRQEFQAQYAPTAAEAQKVASFLAANGLHVVRTGPDNLYVHAQGSIAAVSKAFNVALNRYQVNGKVVRANANDPVVRDAAAAPLVRSVGGLNESGFVHPYEVQSATFTSRSSAAATKSAQTEDAAVSAFGGGSIESYCFPGTVKETYDAGVYPRAVVTGHKYEYGTAGCGYTPKQIQTAYNLTPLYKKGFDGTGQTIVIMDWCGSPTIRSDANAFSTRYGLPPLTDDNFSIVEYPTHSLCSAPSVEINMDVEWAHAIAPGANILLLVPPGADFVDIDEAEYYAIVNRLGNVISGSFGASEIYVDPAELTNQDLLNEIAGTFGISADFSTGDTGDGAFFPGLPVTIQTPAATPHATAVGGVSLALNKNGSIEWQTGWGTNVGVLASGGDVVDTYQLGFQYGSTGGASSFFPKPRFQSGVRGTTRQVPDISWLADPMTGGIIEISLPGQVPSQVLEVAGGTSLACPMFSALWAIANQEAGTPLGQAAPYLYTMPSGTIRDVVALSQAGNVTDTVWTSPTSSSTRYIRFLLGLYTGEPTNYNAIFDVPYEANTAYVISFGTDTTLTQHVGWDNVSGLGTPNPVAFADYFNPAK